MLIPLALHMENIPGTVLLYICPLRGLKEIAGWHDMRVLKSYNWKTQDIN